jgi:metallo-beta-lactamase family protein
MELIFWGATEDVTGSMTFLSLPEGLMAIDCGLFQGNGEASKLNELPFPFPARDLKAVVLTHAHLDHSGLLPRLVKEGFKGKIICTRPTAQLARIILKDSASLPDQTLYDGEDVNRVLHLFEMMEWNETKTILGGSLTLFSAGHILGASSVKVKVANKTVVFSGDIGRNHDPLIPSPQNCPQADVVIMESTYGGRIRKGDWEKELHSFLMKISRENRIGIIASFAVARGQMLITMIQDFFQRHPEDKVRVVFDSPMMSEANEVYKHFSHLLLLPTQVKEFLSDTEELVHEGQWIALQKKKGPLIIISSSGMLTGGRIGRHLLNWHDDEKAVLFLPGYQAKNTPGREMLEGKRILQTTDKATFTWKGEVLGSEAFSSHADENELLDWTKNLSAQTQIFLIHGESRAKTALQKKLTTAGFRVKIPFRSEAVKVI